MALYLVQHGKSYPKDQDPEQGLTPEGKAEVQRLAEVARNYGVPVRLIRHSGKKRAWETAAILAAALNPSQGVQEMAGLNPLDDVTRLASQLGSAQNLMLVGHLPFMERLASYLIIKDIALRVIKFQNGGIVCLDQELEGGPWFIKWTLMPHIG